MGMDVHGKKPSSEQGVYFRNNIWWWRPLAAYVAEVCPGEVTDAWHYNDGAGPDAAGATRIAERLRALVASGDVAKYAALRERQLTDLPDEPCEYCKETGTRTDLSTGPMQCNVCNGAGKKRPMETWYSFSEENVMEFAEFCAASGGFEIW